MARIKTNAIVEELSGGFGNQMMFRHLRDGRTVACFKPDFSRREFSTDQKSHQERFREAAAYAREASVSQPIYAQMATGTIKNAYNLALGDWFHPPVIHGILKKDGKILVQASDDVCVAGVRLLIEDEAGAELEQGNAVQLKGDWWEYQVSSSKCQVPGFKYRVFAEARDLPGNVVRMEMDEG